MTLCRLKVILVLVIFLAAACGSSPSTVEISVTLTSASPAAPEDSLVSIMAASVPSHLSYQAGPKWGEVRGGGRLGSVTHVP